MKIAFYAPMKSPNHPVPSGDRLMGRLLLRVLSAIAGTENVRLASEFRAYSSQPDSHRLNANRTAAKTEAETIISAWESQGWVPDVWFTYHPYYKSPDWIGPLVAERFACPIVTAEASFSARRAHDDWSAWHEEHVRGLRQSSCHLYMKERDRAGLLALPSRPDQLLHLPPFIDTEPFIGLSPNGVSTHCEQPAPVKLITVAMMRADVKLKSYRYLAEALTGLQGLDWTLDIIGDGVALSDVEQAFSGLKADRLHWHGEVAPSEMPNRLSAADIFVWPGFGEAYGLAYLEAQACGLPVVAQNTAGVPEVVLNGETGLLTLENDIEGFRSALRDLIKEPSKVRKMGQRAQDFVLSERSASQAQQIIKLALLQVLSPRDGG